MKTMEDCANDIKVFKQQKEQLVKQIECLRKMIVERNEYAKQLDSMKEVDKKTKEEIASRILHENKALVAEIDIYLEEIKKIIEALEKIKNTALSSSPA